MTTTSLISPLMPDVDFGVDPIIDFYERTAALQAEGRRVAPVRFNGGIAWLILKHKDLAEAYSDEEGLPAAPAYERHTVPIEGRTILAMTGEEHRIQRALVSAAFQPAAIRRLVDRTLVPVANGLIDAFADKKEVDIAAAFARVYPFSVISQMLTIPITDEKNVIDWVFMMLRYFWEPQKAMTARAALDAYVKPIIEARRRNPGDDIISRLTVAEVEGHRLSEDQILHLCSRAVSGWGRDYLPCHQRHDVRGSVEPGHSGASAREAAGPACRRGRIIAQGRPPGRSSTLYAIRGYDRRRKDPGE